MSQLDKRLKELEIEIEFREGDHTSHEEGKLTAQSIAQIKTAFADEGFTNSNIYGTREISRQQLLGEIANPVMTGQEFYDRFEKEFEGVYKNNNWFAGAYNAIMEAAKKAAGLK